MNDHATAATGVPGLNRAALRIRHLLTWLLLGCLIASGTDNLLLNGDFQAGLSGFKTIATSTPPGQEEKTILVTNQPPDGAAVALQLNLSPDTARNAILIQPLKVKTLRAAGVLQLQAKIRFTGFALQDSAQGSLTLRIRERSQGKFLRSSALMWLPFQADNGLKVTCHQVPIRKASSTIADFQDTWLNLISAGAIDGATDSVDFMISANCKSAITIYISDLKLTRQPGPELQILQKPLSVVKGSRSFPLNLQLRFPAEDAAGKGLAIRLRQDGKLLQEQVLQLSDGRHNIAVMIPQPCSDSPLQVELQTANQQEVLEIGWEEDPFAF
jgi:hypothetical protein